jgi:hypothetical protein
LFVAAATRLIPFSSMRRLLLITLASSALAFAGCESSSQMHAHVRERFNAPQPKTQVFSADPRAVFEAAQIAMKQLDFQVSRAALAQGIVNGHSRLQPGDSFGKARQYVMEVRFHSYEPGKTDVSAVLREQEESSSFAGATDLPLREHGLYGSFFAGVERALKEKAGSATPATPAAKSN